MVTTPDIAIFLRSLVIIVGIFTAIPQAQAQTPSFFFGVWQMQNYSDSGVRQSTYTFYSDYTWSADSSMATTVSGSMQSCSAYGTYSIIAANPWYVDPRIVGWSNPLESGLRCENIFLAFQGMRPTGDGGVGSTLGDGVVVLTKIASLPTHSVNILKTGSGSGSITSVAAGISCGNRCSVAITDRTVTLHATASLDSIFAGWGGDCSGASSICTINLNADRNVNATFKPIPFATNTTAYESLGTLDITTGIVFNPDDIGRQGAVYVTAWVPVSALSNLGVPVSSLGMVDSSGANNQVRADPNAFVLVQHTASGWQVVQNGQLSPYSSGLLGAALSQVTVLPITDRGNLSAGEYCVGYGRNAGEMLTAGRMRSVWDSHSLSGAAVSNGSCNIAINPYSGLWWNPAEAGWGMNVVQHDNTVFGVLYTYDETGRALWFAIPNCIMGGRGVCTGDIYQVDGGTPPETFWNGTSKLTRWIGTGTLTFSDANNGHFAYTINGASGSKTISREFFSSGTAPSAYDYTDLWWNASESGWGIALAQDSGMIFAAWFTYDNTGKAIWYVASNCTLASAASETSCTGNLYQVSGGSSITSLWRQNVTVNPVGTLTINFSNANNAVLSYSINGVAASRTITRQPF